MRKRLTIVSSGALTSLIAAGFMLVNCAPEPRLRMPALGEVVSISPIAVNRTLAPAPIKTSAIKLNVMWGGRAMTGDKGDPTLNFYDATGQIKYSFKWAQLERAYHDTSCTSEQVRSLDGYLRGSILICDGSLNLQDITRIEGVEDKGEKRYATSWAVYQVDDDVTSVSVGLY